MTVDELLDIIRTRQRATISTASHAYSIDNMKWCDNLMCEWKDLIKLENDIKKIVEKSLKQ